MPAIRRLLLPALIVALSGAPAWAQPPLAQTLAASTDLLPVQAAPGSPPVSSAPPATSTPPQQTRPTGGSQTPAQSIPMPTSRCTPARPTS